MRNYCKLVLFIVVAAVVHWLALSYDRPARVTPPGDPSGPVVPPDDVAHGDGGAKEEQADEDVPGTAVNSSNVTEQAGESGMATGSVSEVAGDEPPGPVSGPIVDADRPPPVLPGTATGPEPTEDPVPIPVEEGKTRPVADSAEGAQEGTNSIEVVASDPGPEPGQEPGSGAESAAADSVEADKAVTVEHVLKWLSEQKKPVVKSRLTRSDYKRYLASLKMGNARGKPTPELLIAFFDVEEILDVHRYYGMRIVMFEPDNSTRVVELVGLGGDDMSTQVIEQFDWRPFSKRIFARKEPYFEDKRKASVEKGVLSAAARVYTIVPNTIDTYFRYKQIEGINRSEVDSKSIVAVLARFHQLDFGGWLMAAERIRLRDNRVIKLKDFELEELGKSR